MARLLDPLPLDQQRLVEVVAEAFVAEKCEWSFFDYVEGILDHERIDAWETLQSFPRVGRWGYTAIWFIGSNMKPPSELEIMLTLVGMHHSATLTASSRRSFRRSSPFSTTWSNDGEQSRFLLENPVT